MRLDDLTFILKVGTSIVGSELANRLEESATERALSLGDVVECRVSLLAQNERW